jgi:hypothetical protein
VKRLILYCLPVCLFVQGPAENIDPASNFPKTVSTSKSFFRFGDRLLTLEKWNQRSGKSYTLVSLHNDETTAITVAKSFAETRNAGFVQLLNEGKHDIEVTIRDNKIVFDPDKIFTPTGRKENLKSNLGWKKSSNTRVQVFSLFLIDELVANKIIVAVHNNKDGSMNDYAKAKSFSKQPFNFHQNPSLDQTNFFVTNQETLFQKLKQNGFNVLLQNRHNLKDDGSLGVYCTRTNKPFISIETRAGHLQEQYQMLLAVDNMLQ